MFEKTDLSTTVVRKSAAKLTTYIFLETNYVGSLTAVPITIFDNFIKTSSFYPVLTSTRPLVFCFTDENRKTVYPRVGEELSSGHNSD